MKLFIQSIVLIICLSATACQQTNKGNLADEEILNLALKQGDLISEKTQVVLGSKLKDIVQNEGIPQALKYCNVHAYPIVDSLKNVFNAEIKRASHKTRNPGDKPDKTEQKVIDEYMKAMHDGETPSAKVVIDGEHVNYFKPIILSAPLCLSCHGIVGSDISEENYEIIKALYTEDEATGHKTGDLRGIWSIQFERSSLSGD